MITPLTQSERNVLDAVRRSTPITRSALKDRVDLSQQSVHRIVEDLLTKGLLVAGKPIPNGRGQPSPSLALSDDLVFSAGISINTDCASIALINLSCEALEFVTLREAPRSRRATLRSLFDVLNRMLTRNSIEREKLVGLGVAVSGFFTPDGGFNAPEPLSDWSLIDIRSEIEDLFDLPIYVENNATTGAIGEKLLGVGRRVQTFGYLSFNYGFGAGLVLNGQPFFGAHRNAGELTLFMTPEEADNRPALRYLIDDLRAQGIAIDSVQDLRDRFDPDWPGVAAWIERILPQLNRTINAIAGLFDPEAIVFGGQIPSSLGRILIERASFLSRHRYGVAPPQPELVLSESNSDPAAIGAAILPLDSAFFS
jgi:predicted NBD/HSP70 family sugar kinase